MTIRSTLLLILCILIARLVPAQSLPDSIDALFAKWQTQDAPGCAVGIVRDGQLIYAKGFGLANLENKVPNTPATIFYMCSLSKQFAGYAIAQLVSEGKINLDENIRTYLPWMSDFGGKKITVRHLLHHTSGIRDDISLSAFYGLDRAGVLTQEKAVSILKQQRTLNFDPGEQFSYSNSNYVLLAEIVQVVSGRSLKAYADSVIFKPLGMTSSQFVDDPGVLIPSLALSYNGQEKAVQNVYTLGDGGLFSNVEDIAKWATLLCSDSKTVALMTTPGKLADKSNITYAMGINAYKHRGYRQLSHNGGLAGYRTIITVYPELKTGFIVFGNGGDGAIYGMVNQLAALLIPDHGEKKEQPVAPVSTIKDTTKLTRWTGSYAAYNGMMVTISYKAGKLYVNGTMELAPEGKDVFHLVARDAVKYRFFFNPKYKVLSFSSPVLPKPIAMPVVMEVTLSTADLEKYTGQYWSDELQTGITITLKGDTLWLSDKYHDPVAIRMAGNHHLFTTADYFPHANVIWDQGGIKALEYNSGDMRNLLFNKVP